MTAAAEDIRALITRYAGAWIKRDRAVWLVTFADDATQEDPIGDGVRRGHAAIGEFWDRAMSSYDAIEIRERVVRVVGHEAALEWTIVAHDRDGSVVFDGVDVFTFVDGPLINSVRAYWERDARARVETKP